MNTLYNSALEASDYCTPDPAGSNHDWLMWRSFGLINTDGNISVLMTLSSKTIPQTLPEVARRVWSSD